MSSNGKILIVEPGVKLNGDIYKKLAEGGYIVLRGKPEQFHALDVVMASETNAILTAALETIAKDAYGDTKSKFAQRLCEKLLASKAKP